MKDIRKYMTWLAAAGFVMVVSAKPGHAAFTRISSTTLTATAVTGGTAIISIVSAQIKNRTNNAVVGALGWTGATPGAGWRVSDQYIHMVSSITTGNGGIQIYTDNTRATPAYTGVISSFTQTPAGLVDNVDTTQKLPTAWRASTFTLTAVNPINPNANAGESFLWLFHEDFEQVAVPSQNAAAFVPGDAYIAVYAAPGTTFVGQTTPVPGGVHFAQDPSSFGGFHTVDNTYLYTEADFTTALASRTYSTNKLVLEAFSL